MKNFTIKFLRYLLSESSLSPIVADIVMCDLEMNSLTLLFVSPFFILDMLTTLH